MRSIPILAALAPLAVTLACGFVPLPVEKVANSSRTDGRAADGRGGWLDLGSNDLSIFPSGEARYSGVPFTVPPAGDENAKNCLILGRKGAESATLRLETPVAGRQLYLLHAVDGAPAPETHADVCAISIRYTDGSVREHALSTGSDVSGWTGGRSFPNALKAWTEYNRNTQVSVYVSKFKAKADETKRISEITFSTKGACTWMILAATAGEETKLKPVAGAVEVTGAFKSPDPPKGLARMPGRKPKNVILIIGDGMGQGAARLASYHKYGREDGAYFQQFPVAGLCTTYSANSDVTDSAASATAFSTGVKTSNGVLGLQVDKTHDRDHAVTLTSVAARAHAKGLGVAILSSDPLTGATPAAFFAHALGRGESEKIGAQAAACGYDVLLGNGAWMGTPARRTDRRDLRAEMTATGYAYVRTPAEIDAAPAGAKVVGEMKSFGSETGIAEAVAASLKRLADSSRGFFMMAECADTDHSCHANNSSQVVKDVSMVEFMAKAAVDFAQPRGDTLVVVTADHDTGHASVLKGAGPDGNLAVAWSTSSHSKFPVPVYSYGPGAELFEGVFDNTDIAKNVARLLDLR